MKTVIYFFTVCVLFGCTQSKIDKRLVGKWRLVKTVFVDEKPESSEKIPVSVEEIEFHSNGRYDTRFDTKSTSGSNYFYTPDTLTLYASDSFSTKRYNIIFTAENSFSWEGSYLMRAKEYYQKLPE